MTNTRRSDFDVTNTVQVSSPRAVLAAVQALYRPTWPGMSLEPLARAFAHFERLFAGEVPGFHGVDTVYVCGLATDFCVSWTALDARKAGFQAYVIEDASRGIDLNGSLAAAWKQMTEAGVKRLQSGDIAMS